MKRVHLDVVAPPRNRLAAADKFQASQIDDWAGWSMLAGNPFWIDERQRTGRHRNRHVRMKKFPRRSGRIDAERDGPRRNIAFDKLYVKENDSDDGKQRQTQFAV